MKNLTCPFCGTMAINYTKNIVGCGRVTCVMNDRGGVTTDLWNRRFYDEECYERRDNDVSEVLQETARLVGVDGLNVRNDEDTMLLL